MAVPLAITTGEQTVSATGAITGSLSTNGLPRTGWLKCRIRNLGTGQSIRIDIEDTASASAFSDATQVWTVDSAAGEPLTSAQSPYDDSTYGIEVFRLPDMRFGSTNNALRGNCQALSAGATPSVEIWLEQ